MSAEAKLQGSKDAIKYDARSFTIGGRRMIFVGGEFHYFRTPHQLWEDRIIKMKRSGSNLVTTYIPWNWHEQTEGQQVWDDDRDLVRFIELCKKHGMYIIVKPGPYCCAELDFGGHPDWLLKKKIPLRVLDERYLQYVDNWYRKVAEIIDPYLITNGGNIFCIQVENEYDHLINYGEEKITLKDAVTYFKKLGKLMDKYRIDIPKFANEAAFLRGKGIIDTRTYYPNIPFFWDWKWRLEYFDDKIITAKTGQPDCPTMILELQIGWFGMHGHALYMPGVELTEAVSKSVLMQGASVLTYYMFVGGTTFPFWGSRGNIYGLEPRGLGLTTTFDFGGSPIREWGELMPGRYDWIKGFNLFVKDYGALLLESDNVDDIKVLSGGEEIKLIHKDGSEDDAALTSVTEKFSVITKRRGSECLVCVRNLSDEPKSVDIGWAKEKKPIFKGLKVRPHEVSILPVGVRVPSSSVTIVNSTSELLFAKKINDEVYFGLYGKTGRKGKTILDVPASEIKVLSGDVSLSSEGEHTSLEYIHGGIQMIKVRNDTLFIIDASLAGKIEELEGGILIADTYFVEDAKTDGETLILKTQIRDGSENKFYYFGNRPLSSVSAEKKALDVASDATTKGSTFSYHNPPAKPVDVEWQGDWRVKADADEIEPRYNDKDWMLLKRPVSLEEAGLLEHGYVWYRAEFELPKAAKETTLIYHGNDNDRQYIYINGQPVWSGVAEKQEIDIQAAAKSGGNTIAVLYQNFYHNKSHPHEGAIRKYSGIMKPMAIRWQKNKKLFKRNIASLKVRQHLKGIIEGYARPEFDDSGWQAVKSGHKYVMSDDVGGILWMRRKFKFKAQDGWKYAVKLTIPNASQRCLMYINGRAVGWFEAIGPQHDFYVPETFLQENNVLSIILQSPGKGYLLEPHIGTFYQAKEVEVKLQFRG